MTTSLATALPRVEDQDLLDRVIAEQGGRPGSLLSILEKLQERHRSKYLPMETLEYVAARTGVPQAQIYSVATFFALFNLEPQGLHTVSICRGTACHVKGSAKSLEMLMKGLKLKPGETSRDRLFSLEVVACMGACGLAPVVNLNGEFYAKVTPRRLARIIAECREKECANVQA